jgi:hypothetical protein
VPLPVSRVAGDLLDPMLDLLHIAAFWVVVVVAIRMAVCFPNSLLARMLFSHHGPVPIRGEPKTEYLLRCARFRGSWVAQAVLLFMGGWVALRSDPSLAVSLYFLVLWMVVIPAVAGGALLGFLFVLARWFWLQRFGRVHSPHAGHA